MINRSTAFHLVVISVHISVDESARPRVSSFRSRCVPSCDERRRVRVDCAVFSIVKHGPTFAISSHGPRHVDRNFHSLRPWLMDLTLADPSSRSTREPSRTSAKRGGGSRLCRHALGIVPLPDDHTRAADSVGCFVEPTGALAFSTATPHRSRHSHRLQSTRVTGRTSGRSGFLIRHTRPPRSACATERWNHDRGRTNADGRRSFIGTSSPLPKRVLVPLAPLAS